MKETIEQPELVNREAAQAPVDYTDMVADGLKPGYYYLYSPHETEPVLVHAYQCTDAGCFGFGFNVHDGGGFLPLADLKNESRVEPVKIVSATTEVSHRRRSELNED